MSVVGPRVQAQNASMERQEVIRPEYRRRAIEILLSVFFQAEDGIRDHCVTGVQTCALPISSMAQLDGSDIVYVARVSVPKLITLRVEVGTRFPAQQTSQGKVLLAALSPDELAATLAEPSRAGLPPVAGHSTEQLRDELTEVRARGWALADEELAPGVRSVAVPVRDRDGAVRAAMNVTVHAAETSVETLLHDHLPRLLRTAGEISAEWALWQSRPHVEVESEQTTAG